MILDGTLGITATGSLTGLTTAITAAQGGTGLTSAGTNGNVLKSDGTNWASSTALTSATAQASTSGTSITFTSIPSWVKRITVMFSGVTISSTSPLIIQIGSGSVTTTGYFSQGANGATNANYTAGFGTSDNGTTSAKYGTAVLSLLSANTWTFSSALAEVSAKIGIGAGTSPNLSGALDRVVITTVGGTNTFTAGSINIMYE